jgi:hypothetical protein
MLAIAIIVGFGAEPRPASAGILDFLFGSQQGGPGGSASSSSAFADPFGFNPQPAQPSSPAPSRPRSAVAHCVRMCDGRYFPVTARNGTTVAQMCQSFCPASATKVFFGSAIDGAVSASGERYAEIANAFLYRKKLSSDCTCNGRDPAGLAPVDLSLDTTLRPGDVVATATGLVAYSGPKAGNSQAAQFTPVANYPGLGSEVRSRLGEMKVSPVTADLNEDAPPVLPPADQHAAVN